MGAGADVLAGGLALGRVVEGTQDAISVADGVCEIILVDLKVARDGT